MSSSNCCFLTCIQILQEVGKVVWYSHLLNNFPQVKQQGALPTENYAEDAEHGPAYQNKTQFTPQSVSPIRKLPEASYPSLSEGRQTENHNHRKVTSLITWTTAFLTQWNYEPCRVGPPKMDGSWWGVLTKCGPLEKGKTIALTRWTFVDKVMSVLFSMLSRFVIAFCLFILFMGFSGQDTEVACHSFLQWTTFCQNSPPWPIHLGWPYMAWLIASLS